MTLEAEPHVNAGGDWYMSVYDLQDYTTSNVVAGSASSNSSPSSSSGILSSGEPDDIGGDTPVDDNPRTPVPSGDRAFTVVNECSQTIRVGATGGRCVYPSYCTCSVHGLSVRYGNCYGWWDCRNSLAGCFSRGRGRVWRRKGGFRSEFLGEFVRMEGGVWKSTVLCVLFLLLTYVGLFCVQSASNDYEYALFLFEGRDGVDLFAMWFNIDGAIQLSTVRYSTV